MKTDELIEAIAKDLEPVTPLRQPSRRAAAWLVCAALYCAAIALYSGGSEVVSVLADARLWLPQAAGFAVGAAAAFAALASVVPGYPQRAVAWLAVACFVWIAMLVAAAPLRGDLASIVGAREEWECVRLIAAAGVPPLAVLVLMLRRGAPLNRRATGALAAVAAGALLSVAACFGRAHESGAITLVWHGGAILAVALVCMAGAPRVLTWTTSGPARPFRSTGPPRR